MNHRYAFLGFAALFVGAVTTALADVPPPVWPDSPQVPETSRAVLSTGLHMGSFDVLFEKTTLSDVQQAIGAGKIASQGDAAEASLWLCYTFADAKRGGRIWIIASGEMGGSDHLVGLIAAKIDPSVVPTDDCPGLPQKFQPMSFDHGVWLGMKDVDAIRILGPGYAKQDKRISYGYLGKVPGNGECSPDGFDLSNYLMLESAGGMLTSILVGQVTSC